MFKRKKKKEKTFLLGVGCQKGGTTWLYRQLKQHPEVDMGFMKEYHAFDGLYVEELQEIKNKRVNSLYQLTPEELLSGETEPDLLKLIDFYRDTNNYFDYFDQLIQKSDKTLLVGDITPSYSALPKEAFQHIKDQLKKRGFKIKVVFLMRDPLERIWSQIRMGRRRALKENSQFKFEQREEESLLKQYSSAGIELRTRYENTINNLESVFNPKEIFYGIFEEFFTHESIQRLEEFLNISSMNAKLDKKINTTKRTQDILDPNVAKEVVQYYKNTYLSCDAKFKLKEIWTGFQYL